MLSNFV